MMLRTRPRGKARGARKTAVWMCLALLGAAAASAQADRDWPQWGRTPQHGGASAALGQRLDVILADVVYDPFVELMKADAGGDLLAHYATPLLDETGVYMTFKSGAYTGFGNWGSMTWSVHKLAWIGGSLQTVWTFDSDWQPTPVDISQWEPVFQAALSGDSVYVPGLGGTVHRVSKETGVEIERLSPFASLDARRYVAGGLAVAPDGSVVYDAVAYDASDPTQAILGAWLVRVSAGGHAALADFATLVPGAPGAGDACQQSFASSQRPWPPSNSATPPTTPCGAQRPGTNVVPAIAPDGTIYTVSRAHGGDRYSYLVAVHADLTPAWTASLRGILNDGCGVLLPDDNTSLGCRTGANMGVDPATNDRPAGRVNDAGTSSPVVLPDGAIVLGAFTSYNYFRGHLFKFGAGGDALATYDFGWDITPAVYPHDGTYSLLLKDNHYTSADGDSYYYVTSLDADLSPEWSYLATNTESCARDSHGTVTCVDDHPEGFEWCVNQPAVAADGTVYLNSEDGTLYGFDRAGKVVGQIFLDTSLGAAYTPVALGPDGVVYTQNNGHLFVVGQARGAAREAPDRVAVPPAGPRTVAPR